MVRTFGMNEEDFIAQKVVLDYTPNTFYEMNIFKIK